MEKEVATAFEEERKRTVLLPIQLDGPVMETKQAWAADVRRTRYIGDFTQWKEHDTYRVAFDGSSWTKLGKFGEVRLADVPGAHVRAEVLVHPDTRASLSAER